jgi:hypothetical protein
MRATLEQYRDPINRGEINPHLRYDGRRSGTLLDPADPQVPLHLLSFAVYQLADGPGRVDASDKRCGQGSPLARSPEQESCLRFPLKGIAGLGNTIIRSGTFRAVPTLLLHRFRERAFAIDCWKNVRRVCGGVWRSAMPRCSIHFQ